jgi:hypothetical protein
VHIALPFLYVDIIVNPKLRLEKAAGFRVITSPFVDNMP